MTVGMADTVMVTTSGEAAVSGVSLVDNINTLIIQVFSALSTGGAVVVSQYLGRQDTDNAKAASKQLLYAMCALSLLLMGAALVLRQHILALIFGRVEADVMENALVYFLLTATAYPFMGIYNAGAALFRAMGNSKVSMFCSLVVNVINITVNAVLIFGFGMGAAGAGIGTLVSRIAAAVIIMALLNHPDHVLRVEGLLRFEFRGAIVKRILFIGIPNGMENGMFQAGKLMVLNLITTFGTSAVAANAIANSVAGVINVPGMALGLAIITVIGQCMGWRDRAGGLLHQASRGGQLSLHAGHERRPLLLGWGTGHPVSPEPRGLHHGCPSAPGLRRRQRPVLAPGLHPSQLPAGGWGRHLHYGGLPGLHVCLPGSAQLCVCLRLGPEPGTAWGMARHDRRLGGTGRILPVPLLAGQMETHPRDLTAQGGNRMERFQDPERLAALFARCRIPERLPWTAAYPWTLQYYEKGEYLCRLREPMQSLYLLLEGGIQTSLTNAAGRTRLVATAQPGELVGGDVEVVLGNVQATTDQRAQEDGALCAALPLAEYREALCSDLGFLRYASRRLARIVVMNTFRATNDLLLPLENRLAAYLLSQAEDGWFHGTLTRTAETLSTSYRQLTRVMSRFAQAGYLRRTPEGWRLEEPDALQALAESVEPSRIL